MKVTVGPCSLLGQDSENGARGVEIQIADNGIGIPQANLERIFTPFFTNRDSGTGLGLSIVNRIVHDHSGVINVSSEERKGTTFAIRLPAVSQQEIAVGRTSRGEVRTERLKEASKSLYAL